MQMPSTIRDVAKSAGVSHTTVSMVINNDRRITPDTRKKVIRAIKELKYHPNYLARGLVKGKTNTIAVVASFFSSLFEINILKGVEMEIGGFEYNINQYSTRAKRKVKKELLQSVLYGKMADALIALSLKPDKRTLADFKRAEFPVVLVEENMKGVHSVRTDNFKGAFEAVEHLIRKGRKRIGIINGRTSGEGAELSPVERMKGYKKALEAHGVEFDEKKSAEIDHFYFEDGVKSLSKFMEDGPELDGIFCAAGDIVAMGAVKEAKRRGVRIPDDIAIIGFDDIDMSSLISPTLTTVRQPVVEMGRQAFKIAVEAIEGKLRGEKKIVFEPELVIRESA